MSDEQSRRELLRGTGGLAGAAILGGMAGCTGLLGGGEDRPAYLDWVPARSALPGDTDSTAYRVENIGRIVEKRDEIDDDDYENATTLFRRDGVPAAEEVGYVATVYPDLADLITSLWVLSGEFDAGAIEEEYAANLENGEEYGEYTIYQGGPPGLRTENLMTAFGDGTIVATPGGGIDSVKALLDAKAGDANRAVETDDAAERLASNLDDGLTLYGAHSPPDDVLPEGYDAGDLDAIGSSTRIDGDTVERDHLLVYADDPPAAGTIEEMVVENDLAETDDPSVDVSGQVATVTDTASIDRLAYTGGFGIEDESTTPQPVIDFTWDGEELVITHEGGDAVTTENTGESGDCNEPGLGITVDGSASGCWPAPVEAGDSTTVSPDPGQTVRVVWSTPSGGSSQTLAMFDVPE